MTIVIQKQGVSTGGGGIVPQPIGTVAARPVTLSGALSSWVETTVEAAVIRTAGDDGQTIKVRRRVTAPIRTGQAAVTVRAEEVAQWRDWYEKACLGGMLPTRFKFPPNCSEQVWRFASPLTFDWAIDGSGRACRIAFNLEQLPHWK